VPYTASMRTLLTVLSMIQPGPSFEVSFDAGLRGEPATGRLVVYLIREGAHVAPGAEPSDGPFWDDPQPLFGLGVTGLGPGASAVVDDGATSFPVRLSRLPAGTYRAQAVLDLCSDDSQWKREPGNLYSEPVTVRIGDVDGPQRFTLRLTHAVTERPDPEIAGVERFRIRSKLLSEFRGREVMLRAGVVLPVGYDPGRAYPAVYEVPGFGGDDRGAFRVAGDGRDPRTPQGVLLANCFWIVLNPESGNGHTLLADSANNGPCGRALVEELIPALEAKYHLIPAASARLVQGHSSGGWSAVWLAMTYPGTFGGCWSSSPDPVDFRRFQLPDIYGQASMYVDPATGQDLPSLRQDGAATMTIRQENLMEEVLGPDNTSGQQWDSWQAVFGPRNARGHPAALYDPVTGRLDKAVAERYRAYDIGELVRSDPPKYAALFQQRVRLVVGDQDSFYLNEAVSLLKAEVEKVNFFTLPEGGHGYVRVVPGMDHGTILATQEVRAFPTEMIEHLRRNGHVPRGK
jgi:hypothetical protein